MAVARAVRRLVLTASDDAAVRRGALLVEDALRTASLPGADGGRVYLVKRLSLGTIDPTRPPATVALAIERRFAGLRAAAVHAGTRAAAASPAVYFHDAVEPHVALLSRLAGGHAAREWFWPLAVRGFRADVPRALAIRAVLSAALATPAAGAAVVAALVALDDAGVGAVCAALAPGDGDAMLARMGWAPAAWSTVSPPLALSATVASAGVPRRWLPTLVRWIGRWGARDARAVWLAAVALCDEAPARIAAPATATAAARLCEVLAAPASAADVPAAAPAAVVASPAIARTDGASVEPAAPMPAMPCADLDEAPVVAEPAIGEAAPTTDERAPRRPAWLGVPVATEAGGLLFLVRPLARLGLARWLVDRPQAARDFAPSLLAAVARRAGVSADDPLLTALAPADAAEGVLDDDLVAWRAALARWSRRRARLHMAALVRRPARIIATRTHVDVLFDLGQVDVRIRGLGLDVDPGWVPWLGRIVQFHYQERS